MYFDTFFAFWSMGITTAKSEAAIAEDDENRVVVTAKPT